METDKIANAIGRKIKARNGDSGREGFAILKRVSREGLFEKVTTEQRSKGIREARML